jgi:predicted phage terminase large subunit-like protein
VSRVGFKRTRNSRIPKGIRYSPTLEETQECSSEVHNIQAAGAGKTACLLGSFLKVCHHPRTRGVIFRRTLKQSSNNGGLFDAAINLFSKVDPKLKISMRDMQITFSSGAQLRMSYLDDPKDKYNWQGAELSWLGFDEIQQLDFENCIYLFSRLRSTTVDYPLHIRATGNPDPDAWIKKLVEPDLDANGIPFDDRWKTPRTRYFVNTPNGIQIFEDRKDAEVIYGAGKESGIMSFMFQPGNIYSNPVLMKADPSYISRLKSLPRVEMERLLLGSWVAREQSASFFSRKNIQLVQHPNIRANRRFRAWDAAATRPSESNPNPDFTVGVLASREKTGVITIEDVVRIRDVPHIVKETIFNTAEKDGRDTYIALELDPGAQAGAYVKQMQRELSERGFVVRLVRPSKAKVLRFRPFAAIAEAGFVQVVDSDWTKDYLNELEAFTGANSRVKDDQVDATSTATYFLTQEQTLPSFTLPEFSVSNPQFSMPILPTSDAPRIILGEFS